MLTGLAPGGLLRAWMVTVCCQVAFRQSPEPAGNGTAGHDIRSVGRCGGPQRPRAKRPFVAGREQDPLRADRGQLEEQPPRAGTPSPSPPFWPTDFCLPVFTLVLPADPWSPNLLIFYPQTERMTPTSPRCGLAGDDEITSAKAL